MAARARRGGATADPPARPSGRRGALRVLAGGRSSETLDAALPQEDARVVRRGTFLSRGEMDSLAGFLAATPHSLVLNARYLEPDWFADVCARLVRRRSFGARTLVLRAPAWSDLRRFDTLLRERSLGIAGIAAPDWTLLGTAPGVATQAIFRLSLYRTSWARWGSLERSMEALGDGAAAEALGYLARHGALHKAQGRVRLARSVLQHRYWTGAWTD